MDQIAAVAVDDDLVDQAAQQGFFLGLREQRSRPQLRQLMADGGEGALEFGRQGLGRVRGER